MTAPASAPAPDQKSSIPVWEPKNKEKLIAKVTFGLRSLMQGLIDQRIDSENQKKGYPTSLEMRKLRAKVKERTNSGLIVGSKPIAQGTRSLIYLVNDSFRTPFALKITKYADSHTSQEQMREEAHLRELGGCPYVMQLYDQFEVMGKRASILSYHPHTLGDVLRKKFFDLKQILSIAGQLYFAAGTLRKHKIVHCDLKKENIFLSKGGVVQLGDFGLSLKSSELERSTHTLQSLWQRDPRSFFIQEGRTHAIDLWSIGCIMLQLVSDNYLFYLNGVPPARGRSNFMAHLVQVIGPLPDSWKETDFYKKHKAKLEAVTPGNIREYVTKIVLNKFKLKGEDLERDANCPLLIDFLTKAFSYEKRMSLEEALQTPIFRKNFVYVEIIRDKGCKKIDFRLGQYRINLANVSRTHHMFDISKVYRIGALKINSSELLWTDEVELPFGSRIWVRHDLYRITSVFDDWKLDRDDAKGDRKDERKGS